MAEGFELYHIPQQSRRDKLRSVLQNQHSVEDLQGCAGLGGLLPIYDHQPSNLLTCAEAIPDVTSSLMASAIMDNVSNNEPLDLRFIQRHDQAFHGGDFVALSLSSQNSYGGGGDLRPSTVVTSLGPYTGYASVLKGSQFLRPAKQLLDEICDLGFGIYADKFGVDCGLLTDPPPLENLRTISDDPNCGGVDNTKRSMLISLLDEVYKRYKQYHQQIQAVIASFETVAGLSSAAPFASFDLKTMSKHFRCLNNAITDQLHFSIKSSDHNIRYRKEELVGVYGQSEVNNMKFLDRPPVWRPQRGLPKRAVTVLRAWLFDHFLHPYPTDTDKQLLAKQTGLSRNQVSNWFINARVRLWKPMVEEVHTLETRQVHKVPSRIEEQQTSPLGNNSFSSINPSHIKNQDSSSKRARNNKKYNDHNIIVESNKEPMMNNIYDNFSIQSTNRGVSLTLGLHQNKNGITFSETFPLNVDGGNERFVHDFGG